MLAFFRIWKKSWPIQFPLDEKKTLRREPMQYVASDILTDIFVRLYFSNKILVSAEFPSSRALRSFAGHLIKNKLGYSSNIFL